MRRLLLLRHAKTETDAPSGRDFDRRLDDRGRLDAALVGKWLRAHPPLPDLVCVSTAMRARQTWDLVAAELAGITPQPEIGHLDDLYSAGPGELLALIRSAAGEDPQRLMLVGHNPGLHEIALGLCSGGNAAAQTALTQNMPTTGLAIIDFPVEDWGQVSFRGGQLIDFISPKELKSER